ncbi:MAG: GDP-L-fucose synthase [Gammaproteobacteria bacterium]|nr:GDP-L-fucose synthase [Gammaproteobacteria bacterium]
MKNKVFVAGHNGMVGSAIVRKLKKLENVELVVATRNELDLTDRHQLNQFFAEHNIDQVYLAAAKVGGIHANNTYPADFIYQNLSIQTNVIDSAYRHGVSKLLFLGSSCIYPKFAEQPMSEESLLKGMLEPTNEPYAIAKIAGIKMCESYSRQYGVDYRSVMPTNLYGPNDNFHPENSHVVPALMQRFHNAMKNNAQNVLVWGTGNAKREFLHVDDMAAACLYVMNASTEKLNEFMTPMNSHINVGTGKDCSIKELALSMARVVGFKGDVIFDSSKPDGTPRKLLNVDRLDKLGWQSSIDLESGLSSTYNWFLENYDALRKT